MNSFFWIELLRAVLQVGVLFLLIYGVLYYLRGTRAAIIIAGLFIIGLIMAIIVKIDSLSLDVLSYVFDAFGSSLFVAMLVIFQPELRRALAQLGSFIARQGKQRRELVSEIVTAVTNMSRRKCGALIVVERRFNLQTLIDDSIPLDIRINALVLESIFFPNSPLHDGAVLIAGDRLVAARCVLPSTERTDIPSYLGTRHRAAIGTSEICDALIIVVSEETGAISLVERGDIARNIAAADLKLKLEDKIVK